MLSKFIRHGEKGENRTNSCLSTTRHGSDAFCRAVRSITSPDLCRDSFYYILVSEQGVESNYPGHAALVSGASCDPDLDTLSRGIFLTKKMAMKKEVTMGTTLAIEALELELLIIDLYSRLYADNEAVKPYPRPNEARFEKGKSK